MKDLLLLVPDKNTHFTLKGALSRHMALGIRPITFDFLVHPGRDGGVRTSGPALAALKRRQFQHLLMFFDHEGCGNERSTATALIQDLEQKLDCHWNNDARVIVIEPELDIWMWGSDNAMSEILQWQVTPRIRDWLLEKDFEFGNNGKPLRPKEALEAVLEEIKEPRSSSLYEKIAQRLSISRCQDPAFTRLKLILQNWFPVE